MSKKGLFEDFPEISAKAWKQKIQFDIKGADYNQTLVWESLDGIKIKPFYHADDLEGKPNLSINLPDQWQIGQSIYVVDAVKANKKACEVVKKGVESISFTITRDTVSIRDLLKDIDLAKTKVYIDLRFLSHSYITTLIEEVGEHISNVYIHVDLIGHLARTGNWFDSLKKDHEQLEKVIKGHSASPPLNILSVDVGLYQNAGATRIQQLAYALAHANEYLLHFSKMGIDIISSICFKVSIDSEHFLEIAKLRALRLLFESLITQKYGTQLKCHIIATPTKRNKTLYDAHVNLLRTSTESMSSILGGADMVYNTPFDAHYRKDNEFTERLARNQLLILKNESYLEKVDNITAGSYYIESLTMEMAQKALKLFKSIETGGGFLQLLKKHTIQRKIKESAAKEQTLFENGQKSLVGTNIYINDLDQITNSIELYPFVKIKSRKTLIEPIVERRLAEKNEKRRLHEETEDKS